MFDAMPGKLDGGHLSSSGHFAFADTFSIDFFPLRVMAILLMTLTSTGWLMNASPQDKIRALRTFEMPGQNRSLSADILGIIYPDKTALSNTQCSNGGTAPCPLCSLLPEKRMA